MISEIAFDLAWAYGVSCTNIIPLQGGWINNLYRAETESSNLIVVKEYSARRFDKKRIKDVEAALGRQQLIQKAGFPCPYVYTAKSGGIFRFINDDSYIVMSFAEGINENHLSVNLLQLESLGDTCALMHKMFSDIPVENVKGYPINGNKTLSELIKWYEDFSTVGSEYANMLNHSKTILDSLDSEFFDKLPKGIAHEDFTSDNVLFNKDSVSAVVDLDCNKYSYMWHDVGRALLSFALENGKLNMEKVNAFICGYSNQSVLKKSDIIDALRITWCIEMPWWFSPETYKTIGRKVLRYRSEIEWVTENWFELEEIMRYV